MTKIKSSCKTLPRMHCDFFFLFNKHLRLFFLHPKPKALQGKKKKRGRKFRRGKSIHI